MALIKKNQGGALLTALFIMTLVAIVATAMSSKLQTDIYRTRLIITHDKLLLAAQAVNLWAMGELNDPKKQFRTLNAQGAVSEYPPKMAHLYPSLTLSGALYDLQGKYNLNNLSEKKYILGFVNFLGAVDSHSTMPEKVNLALAINDWITPYDLGVGKDQFSSYYLNLKPPYYPSRQLMSSSSELRLVKDVSAKLYLALEPFVTALPEKTTLNINTAQKKVLLSLSNAMNEEKANEIIEARGENGIKKLDKINELLQKLNISNEQITLESNYFLSVARVSGEEQEFVVYTLLKRNRDKKSKASTTILRQSFNVF